MSLGTLKYLIVLFWIGFTIQVNAQLLIEGEVRHQSEPVFAANVYLISQPSKGQVTDFDGYFTLRSATNNQDDTLVVTYIGFETLYLPLKDIDLDEPLRILINENTTMMKGVEVIAKRSISEEFSPIKKESIEIYMDPTSSGDVLKGVTSTPSSTTVDESASLSLRGSEAGRSKVLLNAVPIYNPVRNSELNGTGNFSLFNTEMMDYQLIYGGNPPLIYGNTSAGLVDIHTKQELDGNSAQLSLSLANTGFFLSQKLNEQDFVQAYANLTFAQPFLALQGKGFQSLKNFKSWDAGFNIHKRINKHHRLNSFSYGIAEGSETQLKIFTHEGIAQTRSPRFFNVSNYRFQKDKNLLTVNQGISTRNSQFLFGNLNYNHQETQIYHSINYKRTINSKLFIQGGVTSDYSKVKMLDSIPYYYYAFQDDKPTYLIDTLSDALALEPYVYGKYYFGEKAILGVGVRKNIPIRKIDSNYLSFQANLRYNLKKKDFLIFSIGQYHSYDFPGFLNYDIELMSSQQYSLEYSHIGDRTRLSGALFYKKEKGAIFVQDLESPANSRNILGLELGAEYAINDHFKIYLANTFIDSRLSNGVETFQDDNDMDYFIKAVLSFNNPNLFGASLSYFRRPGLYYTSISHGTLNPGLNVFEPNYASTGFDQQYDAYHTLNLTANKLFKFKEKHSGVVFLSCNNLLDFKNQRTRLYNNDYSAFTFDYYRRRLIYFGVLLKLNY